MNSKKIAEKITFIKCNHKVRGSTVSCLSCLSRIEKCVEELGSAVIIAAARYLEYSTPVSKITPLTWCQAYEITGIILKAARKESDAISG